MFNTLQFVHLLHLPMRSPPNISESFPLIYPVPTEFSSHGIGCLPLEEQGAKSSIHLQASDFGSGPSPCWKTRMSFWIFQIEICGVFAVFWLPVYLYTYTQSLLQVRHSVPVHPLCRAPELNSLFWCWNLIIHALKFFFMLWDGNWPKTTTIYPQSFISISDCSLLVKIQWLTASTSSTVTSCEIWNSSKTIAMQYIIPWPPCCEFILC